MVVLGLCALLAGAALTLLVLWGRQVCLMRKGSRAQSKKAAVAEAGNLGLHSPMLTHMRV